MKNNISGQYAISEYSYWPTGEREAAEAGKNIHWKNRANVIDTVRPRSL